MAIIDGPLWKYNLARIVVVDVTDDYELMQSPMPNECYPVVAEVWMPRHHLDQRLSDSSLIDGFQYDWHQGPDGQQGEWYVGVVRSEFIERFEDSHSMQATA